MPTDPQKRAIPFVLRGENVLLIAPTATGKTEAAILPILNNFLLLRERKGIKILYLTPLRALNRDLLGRLEWWCKRLDVKVMVRHGDTEVSERGKQALSPPDMLITTPETLQAILTGKIMRRHLSAVRWVIIDEVHELACDKRGSQLALGLERLRYVTIRDFQVIGLSATIGTPEKVAKFLVGSDRKCQIVKVPVARDMKLQILYPRPSPLDDIVASKLYIHTEVAARLRAIRELIEKYRSVLLFTNTRAVAEVLASRFKVWDIDFPISIHHGSLSKPARIWAEKGLKGGQLKGLVCTSSLELGIDIGRVDLVIQYNSPRQVTRLVQRVGRSGHRVGKTPEGVIITLDPDDTFEAMAIARRTLCEELEPVLIPEKPYDALSHQIAGLMVERRRWHYAEALDLFRGAYSYRDLSKDDLEKVLSYMHDRYPRLAWYSPEEQVFIKPQRLKPLYEYYFGNLSMIPDERQYLVVDESSDTPVGVLDEAFVAEHGQPGVKFIVQGKAWKIHDIYGDKIHVKPVDDPTGAIPRWVGEEIPVPFEVAVEVGAMRRFIEERLKEGRSSVEVAQELAGRYPASVETVEAAMRENVEQFEDGYPAPTDRRVTVEEWKDYVLLQCCFGSLVNKTLVLMLGHILSERVGHVIAVQDDPYRIILQVGDVTPESLVETLQDLTRMDVRAVAVEAVVKTGLFKRRIVHVAKKFGEISKWADYRKIHIDKLLDTLKGTAIFEEAVKDTVARDMDVEKTAHVLGEIAKGTIEVSIVKGGEAASPIARIGIQRISRKTDLIPPKKMRGILIKSAKARLLNEVGILLCTNCWKLIKTGAVKKLKGAFKCPACGSSKVGLVRELEEHVLRLSDKKGKGLSEREGKIRASALRSAELVSKYGYPAVVALAGHGLKSGDVEEVLLEGDVLNDSFYERIIEAERKALKRRFW